MSYLMEVTGFVQHWGCAPPGAGTPGRASNRGHCPLVIQVVQASDRVGRQLEASRFSRRSFSDRRRGSSAPGDFRHGLCGCLLAPARQILGCSTHIRAHPGSLVPGDNGAHGSDEPCGRTTRRACGSGMAGKAPDRSEHATTVTPGSGNVAGQPISPFAVIRQWAAWHQTGRHDGWHSPLSVIRFNWNRG